ncbi:hypothetical protein [Agromyces sp. ZXT2-3]|uniref:hypothetical protein n=1 Tax=Agromyces sp. ZXT2-3 TaxID=3461152 RepID=UPI004054E65E
MSATSTAAPPRTPIGGRIRDALGSRWTLWGTVALAFVSAMAIALSADYFLLYDEFYHVGIIRLMAEQGTPFLTDTDAVRGLGDVERYGSYLYHFVMSWPYAVASSLGWSEYATILLLRVLTVLMAVGSIPVFAAALRRIGVGPATANTAMLAFSSLPVLSFIAATVNYDAMLLLASATFSLLIARAATERPLRLTTVVLLIAVGGLGSLTKYTFLPVFVSGIAGLVILLLIRGRAAGWSSVIERPRSDLLRSAGFWAALAVAVVAVGLFIERYVGNLLAFGNPSPDCATVHDAEYCEDYGPWRRNEELDANHPDSPIRPGSMWVFFARSWANIIFSTLDVVGGETSQGIRTAGDLSTYGWFALVGTVIALFLIVLLLPRILRNGAAVILAATATTYLFALFWLNYGDFRSFGIPIGIQSRYVLQFVPLLLAAAGVGLSRTLSALQRHPLPWKIGSVVVIILAGLQGGWALSYLVSYQPTWFHPESPIGAILPALQRVAGLVVLTG